MIPLLKRLVHGFLYDQDMGPRWASLGLGALGATFSTGGNVPGTQIVVPEIGHFQWLGPWMLLGALAITSITSSLPKEPPKS